MGGRGGGAKAHGPWPKAHGPRPMAHGPRPMAHGPRPMAHGPWPMAQGPWPMAHGPWSKNILYFQFFLHELALERCYEALDRSELKDFSFSIDLEGSQGRFISLKGDLSGSKGPRSENYI